MVRGTSGGGQRVGDGAGSVHDVNNDSLTDIAVYRGREERWDIYLGDRTTGATPSIWNFDSSASVPAYPTVGYFFGDSQQVVGFPRYERTDSLGRTQFFLKYSFFKVAGEVLQSEPFMVFDPSATILSGGELSVSDILALDLDKDGDDELIVGVAATLIGDVLSNQGLIWIFEGGPNFQVDSPTVVLRDTEENNDLRMTIADFNGDRLPDILLAGFKVPGFSIAQYKFFWGKPSLQQLSPSPDHSITLKDAAVSVINLETVADLDGDQIADIAGTKSSSTALFLSRSGKPITQRTFTLEDAERLLLTPKDFFAGKSVGSLGDSAGKSGMLTLYGPDQHDGAMLLALNGDTTGPIDGKYDAYYASSLDNLSAGNVFGHGGPAGDVNGDGWSDYLTAEAGWFGNSAGIAMILAGGPYIPRDDGISSVRDIPVEGKSAGLSVWPNPVREVLNIAWRGDLQRMPRRFVIHTISGERVAGGEVEPSIGAAVWQCEGVASGSYVLTAYDRENQVIATTTIIKQ